MFSAERLMLLASVALAAHVVLVVGFCNSDSKGDTSGRSVQLPDVDLKPLIPNWNIAIPDNVYGCDKVGVVVMCCDEEAPPLVAVSSLGLATIARRGAALSSAVVSTTVYCRDAQPAGHYPHKHGWMPA